MATELQEWSVGDIAEIEIDCCGGMLAIRAKRSLGRELSTDCLVAYYYSEGQVEVKFNPALAARLGFSDVEFMRLLASVQKASAFAELRQLFSQGALDRSGQAVFQHASQVQLEFGGPGSFAERTAYVNAVAQALLLRQELAISANRGPNG